MDMSFIPALVASIDGRLDELASEISTLHEARAALSTRTPKATAADNNGQPAKRPPRSTPRTRRPAPKPSRAAADATSELTTTAPTPSKSTAKPRRRRSPGTGSGKRALSSISAEQLEQLLAGATSGLSASAIATQTGVGHSRVLGQLRALEASRQVRRTGSRRSTVWLLITDEERIAQRTAELELQLSSRRHDRTQRRGRARAS